MAAVSTILLPISPVLSSKKLPLHSSSKILREFSVGLAVASSQSILNCRKAMAAMAAGENAAVMASNRPFGVLFVCLGNICRSPSAEAVFRYIVEKRGLSSRFNIDSAGTIDYHEGDPADARMKAAAIKRGVLLTSISRPIKPSDFDEFDLILAMDKKNKADILKAYTIWNKNQPYDVDSRDKVKLMCSYCQKNEATEVPDPYYGGPAGFEKVLDLLEDACEGLLDSIMAAS
ncbi:uncharacterized protein LOC9631047 [Selaginella moellendorffii]|uniref:uncharacterized protein LOC9631047 n=1 Tax=Selaginella moellendorffii TaxID=88036 RepID=UPI000D1C457D|nr:uncharacterized protein LOC9631047 [Selaginella moellendorffii]|eukprot:XP_024528228.1 uncharacterized protein LOC9631047 [Selaginella moellendorffii]